MRCAANGVRLELLEDPFYEWTGSPTSLQQAEEDYYNQYRNFVREHPRIALAAKLIIILKKLTLPTICVLVILLIYRL